MIVLASSRVYPWKSSHCVVPSQKKGTLFWSTKYLPLELTFSGKAIFWASTVFWAGAVFWASTVFWASAVEPIAKDNANKRRSFFAVGFILYRPFENGSTVGAYGCVHAARGEIGRWGPSYRAGECGGRVGGYWGVPRLQGAAWVC